MDVWRLTAEWSLPKKFRASETAPARAGSQERSSVFCRARKASASFDALASSFGFPRNLSMRVRVPSTSGRVLGLLRAALQEALMRAMDTAVVGAAKMTEPSGSRVALGTEKFCGVFKPSLRTVSSASAAETIENPGREVGGMGKACCNPAMLKMLPGLEASGKGGTGDGAPDSGSEGAEEESWTMDVCKVTCTEGRTSDAARELPVGPVESAVGVVELPRGLLGVSGC